MSKPSSTHEMGLDHLKQLMNLAKVEGESDEVKQFLKQTATAWQLSDADLERIRIDPSSIRDTPATDRMDRTRQLYDLIFMVMQDGRYSDYERNYTLTRAIQMGFSKDDVDMLIGLIKEQLFGRKGEGGDDARGLD